MAENKFKFGRGIIPEGRDPTIIRRNFQSLGLLVDALERFIPFMEDSVTEHAILIQGATSRNLVESKLFQSAAQDGLTIGDGTAGVDYFLKFNGEDSDGIILHREDEARFDINQALNVSGDITLGGSGDPAKKMRFETDTHVTTGNTRVITMADQNIDLTPGVDFAAQGGHTANRLLYADNSGGVTNQASANSLTSLLNSASDRLFTIRNIGAGIVDLAISGNMLLGDNTATDFALTFRASANDGILTWDQDPGIFKFDHAVDVTGTLACSSTFTINSTTGVGSILDEDDLASDSATALATQQSIKTYVDSSIGFSEDLFFNDTVASGIGGIYRDMTDADLGGGESTMTTGPLVTGDDQPLVNFVTLSGFPAIKTLRTGIYDVHVHIEKTDGTKPLTVYAEIYTRTAGGTETLRMTTEVSGLITSKVDIDLHASLSADIEINDTDRIVVKWFANVGVTGNAVDVTLYAEGGTTSHLTLPTTTDILSHVFVRQDGTKALSADWDAGEFRITSETLTIDGIATFDGTFAGTGFLDEDNMASNAADKVASQQSIKAYVDAASTSPGGSDTQLQYNDGGAFGGLSAFTWDDTNFLIGTNTKLQFRDSGIFIQSDTDGQLLIEADAKLLLGLEGDIGLGVGGQSVTHAMSPLTTLKFDLGDADHAFRQVHFETLKPQTAPNWTTTGSGTDRSVDYSTNPELATLIDDLITLGLLS